MGARLGGDNITTHLVPLSTGVDMVECCIKIALGVKPTIEAKWNKGSAIRYFQQHEGVIKCIDGIEAAKNIPGIRQVSIVHGMGMKIGKIDSSGARMGFVIAQGDDAQMAINDCKIALEEINVIID